MSPDITVLVSKTGARSGRVSAAAGVQMRAELAASSTGISAHCLHRFNATVKRLADLTTLSRFILSTAGDLFKLLQIAKMYLCKRFEGLILPFFPQWSLLVLPQEVFPVCLTNQKIINPTLYFFNF